VSDCGDILHEDPGSHGLNMIDNAVEYLPDHTEQRSPSHQTVIHQDQTERQLTKQRHQTAVELKLCRPTIQHTILGLGRLSLLPSVGW